VKPFEQIRYPGADALAKAAATGCLEQARAAKNIGKPFHAALSGGRIAELFFDALVAQCASEGISLAHVHFFWADERCVPPESIESNFRKARERLFEPLRIPASSIHRVKGELEPCLAAVQAEQEIRRVVADQVEGQPRLDFIQLGMGEDGHVASLFPDESESEREGRAVYRVVKNSPKPPPVRVTLGYPAIVAAKAVWVLVSGNGKKEALHNALELSGRTPLGRVLALRKATRILSAE
jgi:6-phosphogluconolactonase